MDRRKDDRGYAVIIRNFAYGLFGTAKDRRSGQDRRKHDLLAEARGLLRPVQITQNAHREQESAQAVRILITMMERRK